LGIGDWGFGPIPKTPNPKPQTPNPIYDWGLGPIPNPQLISFKINIIFIKFILI